MTLRAVTSFRGEVPLMTPRALPDNASQAAVNSRLYTGDLSAFKQFLLTQPLANDGPVQTISLMAADTPYAVWLSWDEQVDVARGTVPGDTTYRTYLTGLDAPRFTNLEMATTGGPPYPGETRLLGVPPPDAVPTLVVGVDTTPTTFSIDIFDDCSDLATNWGLNAPQVPSGTSYVSEVTQDLVTGNPAPSFFLEADNNYSNPAYAFRDFGTSGATVIHASWDIYVDGTGSNDSAAVYFMFACDSLGSGSRVYVNGKIGDAINVGVSVGTAFSSGNGGSLSSGAGPAASWHTGLWYTVDATLSVNADGTQTIHANVYLGSVQLASVTVTNTFTTGGVFGPINGKGDDALTLNYDNIHVQAAGSLGVTITDIATSYVYTFVNDLGEESAPSLPSSTILRPDGVSVTITTPTTIPTGISTDYFIQTKRLYRAATGSTGTAFRFVAEIPLAQADYVDTLSDTELGDVLPSDIWALPPNDLEGILALPNGVMVGFSKNQLCFSAQNFPHAWPVEYRLNTDTFIVGIGNIDTTVVIGTKSFLYVATGNDPAAYSMSKFEVPHACSSKRSFAYITGLGVVFSGPQGLMVVRGVGQASNLTEEVFTLRQWQALDPTSIFSVAHDDIYFMFWDNGAVRGCYAVDLRPSGFGVVEMAFHASAAYTDPITDTMYLVLDQDDEPDTAVLPIPPQLPVYIDSKTIYQFEGSDTDLMVYRWRTKLWLEPYPAFHGIAQVRAETYDNLVARFYGDGVLLDEIVVDGEVEFTLTPPDHAYETFEMELLGTDTVRVLQAANDVTELG